MKKTLKTDPRASMKKAFYEAICIKAVNKTLGLSKSTVSHLKIKAEQGSFPSYGTMYTILEKTGYKIIQEEIWEKSK